MNLKEYKEMIIDKTSSNFWNVIGLHETCGHQHLSIINDGSNNFKNIEINFHDTLYVLKKNITVSFQSGFSVRRDFKEKWANSFPDPHASSSYIEFFYLNQLVYRDMYVSVDGARCHLPLPRIDSDEEGNINRLHCSREKYEFFRIINNSEYDYDNYFARTGIELTDDPWMV